MQVWVGEPWAKGMALQMIDGNERTSDRMGERLARHQPHHHPANQPWAGGCSNGIHIRQRHARLGQRLFHQRRHHLHMRARRDFGDDATKGPMMRLLRCQTMRQNLTIAGDQRGCCFIAAGFKAKNECHCPSL